MRLKLRTFLLPIAALVLPSGCAVESPPDPSLYSVCLSAEDQCISSGYAGERTVVALVGEHFHPAFEVDLGDSDAPPARGEYQASISGRALEDVRRVTDALLLGTIPGTVPLGSHGVVVEMPGGQIAILQNAFQIVDPLEVTTVPQHPRIPEGYVSRLDVTLQNRGTAQLTQITLSLSQEGTGRVQLPADSVVTSLGGNSTTAPPISLQIGAEQAGSATLLLEVSALAGGLVQVGTPEPLAVDILVLPQAALMVSTDVSPTAADPGERFELIVTVYNTGGMEALDVEVLAPTISGSGSVALDDPAPAAVDIPAGSARTISWGGQALTRGTVDFDARVQGREAISQRPLGPIDAPSASLEIR